MCKQSGILLRSGSTFGGEVETLAHLHDEACEASSHTRRQLPDGIANLKE